MDSVGWEVSIVVDQSARQVVASDVEGDDLERAILTAWRRIAEGAHIGASVRAGAVLVQRMDATAEARRAQWEAEFYDIDRAGRRRRRYRRPVIEKEWEAWQKAERKATREAAQVRNDSRG